MPNTYVMTKAAAEQLIKHEAEGLPVTIFRPAIGKYSLINAGKNVPSNRQLLR